jgi:hypothetical protein
MHMPVIVKLGQLKIIVATNDHGPPHVHAIYGKGLSDCEVNMKIYLEVGRVEMVKGKFSRNQLVKIQSMYESHLAEIVAVWNSIHGEKA